MPEFCPANGLRDTTILWGMAFCLVPTLPSRFRALVPFCQLQGDPIEDEIPIGLDPCLSIGE